MSQNLRVVRDQRDQAIAYLADHPDCGRLELANAVGWGEGTARKFLAENRPRKRGRPRKTAKEVMPNTADVPRSNNAQPQLASAPAGAAMLIFPSSSEEEKINMAAPRPPRAIAPGLGIILTAIGYAMIPLAVGINAQTGWRFGTTPEAAVTFAGLSGVADVLAIWLPSGAVELWLARRWISSASAWAVWAVVVTAAALASVGFASLNLTDTAAARAAAIDTAKTGAEQRTARIETAKEARIAATLARQSECQIRGPKCRDLERQEQARMTELSAAVAAPVPVVPPIADPDPQVTGALRLATWVGVKVTDTDVGNLRLALMGLLPNLAGLVLAFSRALCRRA